MVLTLLETVSRHLPFRPHRQKSLGGNSAAPQGHQGAAEFYLTADFLLALKLRGGKKGTQDRDNNNRSAEESKRDENPLTSGLGQSHL